MPYHPGVYAMINAANAPKVTKCFCCDKVTEGAPDKPWSRSDSFPVVGNPHLRVCGECDKKTKRTPPITIGNEIAKYHRTMDKLEAKERAAAEKRAAREVVCT